MAIGLFLLFLYIYTFDNGQQQNTVHRTRNGRTGHINKTTGNTVHKTAMNLSSEGRQIVSIKKDMWQHIP